MSTHDYPASPPPFGSAPPTDPTAVMGRRIGAWVVDVVLWLVIAAFLLPTPLSPLAEYYDTGDLSPGTTCEDIERDIEDANCVAFGDRLYFVDDAEAAAGFVVLWVVAPLFYVALQGATGRTPGKGTFGVKVVDGDGGTPGFGRSLLRTVLWIIDGIPGIPLVGFVTGLTSTGHRRVGDMAANTFVVAGGHRGPVTVPGMPATGAHAQAWGLPGQQPSWGDAHAGGAPGQPAPWGAPAPGAPPAAWGGSPAQDLQPPAGDTPRPAEASGAAAPAEGAGGHDGPAPTSEAGEAGEPRAPASGEDRPAAPAGWAPPGGAVPAGPAEAASPATDTGSATPEDRPAADRGSGAGEASAEAATGYNPQWDAARGTYIVWEPMRAKWLGWDQAAQEWKPL